MHLISLAFIAFFFTVVLLYYLFPKGYQWMFLCVVSIFFYAQADPIYLIFLTFSVLSTYLVARGIQKATSQNKKKCLLALALVSNIGVLFVLKFFAFGVSTVNLLLGRLNLAPLPTFALIVPLGIAFYTLQAAGYCIDVYRGRCSAQQNLVKYALFICFFAQVIQGPIARYEQLEPQLLAEHRFHYKNVKFGLQLALYGYFKKVVVADRMAIFVNHVFTNYTACTGAQILLAAIGYAIQIYADFSGCVDICRGVAQALDIDLAKNFDHPYFATSIADFWRRWHISLSTWLRDYLYIPLGGNRKGRCRKYSNIMIVFLVSGLWHGVGVHYLVWGFLHGLYQVVGGFTAPFRKALYRLLKIKTNTFSFRLGQTLTTFSLVTFAWIYFRADLQQANAMIGSIFTNFGLGGILTDRLFELGLDLKNWILLGGCVVVMLVVSLLQQRMSIRQKLAEQQLWFRWSVYLIGLFSVLIFGIFGPGFQAAQFIYMGF